MADDADRLIRVLRHVIRQRPQGGHVSIHQRHGPSFKRDTVQQGMARIRQRLRQITSRGRRGGAGGGGIGGGQGGGIGARRHNADDLHKPCLRRAADHQAYRAGAIRALPDRG